MQTMFINLQIVPMNLNPNNSAYLTPITSSPLKGSILQAEYKYIH